jgi:hypothetical protein
MSTPELQPNTSNLQTLETEVALTQAEMEEFRKLPKEERERLKDEKLEKLKALQDKLDQAIQEAIQTGQIEEAKRLQDILGEGIKDLEKIVEYTERPELPEGAKIMEIITDPEINSAEIAITKLETEGYQIPYYAKDMLTKVNWQEELKSYYEVVSFSVGELFGDTKRHTQGDIKAKAQELGLDLIPQALAPSIRLNYPKNGERTIMALKEPIRGRDGILQLFYCGESWLHSYNNNEDIERGPSLSFFFIRK